MFIFHEYAHKITSIIQFLSNSRHLMNIPVFLHIAIYISEKKNSVPLHGNFELRPLGVAMGNALSVTRV